MVTTPSSKGKFLQKNNKNALRVRFAPSPTGKMHLGNVRTALENYLFAQKHHGSFILRVEDTDFERNFDPGAHQILADLAWLNLSFDEGPYFQSQRTDLYQEKLNLLAEKKMVYRCFCTQEELEKKRERQIALKKPPRYDRTCLHLTEEQIQKNLAEHKPCIWRFHVDETKSVSFEDLAHGTLSFDLANFSDFAITRQDGSFTFIFANAIDDALMQITHVLRGDDHLSNTVSQIAIFKALQIETPIYWHLPVLCNKNGKKLSKRDFGFSLEDLKSTGYLSQALVNYLGIIGGSVVDEIMTLEQLVQTLPDKPSSTSHITYDLEKLNWVNRKWIEKLSAQELANACKPFLVQQYKLDHVSPEKLGILIGLVQSDLVTLQDSIAATKFYFAAPTIAPTLDQATKDILEQSLKHLKSFDIWSQYLKQEAKKNNLPLSKLFPLIREILTGSPKGPHVQGIFEVLETIEVERRLKKALVA